jgi:hypothetical protein
MKGCRQSVMQNIAPRYKIVLIPTERMYAGEVPSE